MNNVNIIGNLTRDPEMKRTNNDTPVVNFTVAVNTGWGDNKKTAFIPVTVWNKAAESCRQYLNKGSKVAVSGRIDTGSYEKDDRTYYTWTLNASNVEFLTTKNANNKPEDNPTFDANNTPDDEIPF